MQLARLGIMAGLNSPMSDDAIRSLLVAVEQAKKEGGPGGRFKWAYVLCLFDEVRKFSKY